MVVSGNSTGDGFLHDYRLLGANDDVILDVDRVVVQIMSKMDACRPNSVYLTDSVGEIGKRSSTSPAEEDIGQGGLLVTIGPLVEIQSDPPGRPRFVIVVVADQYDLEPGQVHFVERAPFDAP